MKNKLLFLPLAAAALSLGGCVADGGYGYDHGPGYYDNNVYLSGGSYHHRQARHNPGGYPHGSHPHASPPHPVAATPHAAPAGAHHGSHPHH